MSSIPQLLHHLVDHAPGLSEENRKEYHEVIVEQLESDHAEPSEELESAEEAPKEM